MQLIPSLTGFLLGSRSVMAAAALIAGFLSTSVHGRDAITGSQAFVYTDGSDSLPYRVFTPAAIPAQGAPLVVVLHGAGERGNNNTSQVNGNIQGLIDATENGATAAYLLAPQCPSSDQWTNIPFGAGSYTNPKLDAPAITTPMRLMLQLVDQFISTHKVDRSRVYITGLSMGGYGTWDAIARRPDLFAAAAPVCGGGNISHIGTYAKIPLWAFHGSADGVVPVTGSRSPIAAIQAGGGGLERYTEYEGGGHGAWECYNNGVNAYDTDYNGTSFAADGSDRIYDWLFAQKKPGAGQAGAGKAEDKTASSQKGTP